MRGMVPALCVIALSAICLQVSGAALVTKIPEPECLTVKGFHDRFVECLQLIEQTPPEVSCSLADSGPCAETLTTVLQLCYPDDQVHLQISAALPVIRNHCHMLLLQN